MKIDEKALLGKLLEHMLDLNFVSKGLTEALVGDAILDPAPLEHQIQDMEQLIYEILGVTHTGQEEWLFNNVFEPFVYRPSCDLETVLDIIYDVREVDEDYGQIIVTF